MRHANELSVEQVMESCGWEAVWIPHAGDPVSARVEKRIFVGTWTGPERDMLCVKPCETVSEANRALAPPGKTLADAIAQSLRVLAQIASPPVRTSLRGNPSTQSRNLKKHQFPRTRHASGG